MAVVAAPGERIGRYTLLESKGSGGMGSVWEAEAPDGAIVAVKVMHDHLVGDDELLKRFMREYEVGRNVNHPSLVRMLDFGRHDGTPFLVMELATGKSLRRLIDKGGPFREWEALEITARIADGLEALERQGVVHRDLKSSNVVVDRDLSVKIIDYGIAKVEGERTLGDANSFVGSAEFSSPEHYFGRTPGAKADVYSAGVVLFEMLVGKVPFRSDRYTDTLRMHAELPVPRPSQFVGVVSPEVDDLDASMMQKQPERRPTAQQVAQSCRRILVTHGRGQGVMPQGAAPAPARPPSPPPRRFTQPRDTSSSRDHRATIIIALAGAVSTALVISAAIAALVSA